MKKILIVEDDQIVAGIYRNKLTVEGYQVEVAHDGETGLEVMNTFQPDAMLMDLMLPKLNGVELLRRIRSGGSNVPVIVFSNTYLTSMVQEAWKAGATKCLSKGNASPREVVEVMRSVTGGAVPGRDVAPLRPPAQSSPVPAVGTPVSASVARQPEPTNEDAVFQAELRTQFLEGLPATLVALRALMLSLIKADSEASRLKFLQELYRKIHTLTGSAAITGVLTISQMAEALEALLKELHEKPRNLNASTMRTLASGIDFLGVLFEQDVIPAGAELPTASVLVVDDEVISRRAITYALEKAKLKAMSVEDPQIAYKLLSENRFDLVFLDVDMPGMNGYELCSRLRGLAYHKTTPVVFVTSLNDFENRAQSMVSGGNDFLGKPFIFVELAVKALIYVLKRRLVVLEKAPAETV